MVVCTHGAALSTITHTVHLGTQRQKIARTRAFEGHPAAIACGAILGSTHTYLSESIPPRTEQLVTMAASQAAEMGGVALKPYTLPTEKPYIQTKFLQYIEHGPPEV